MNVGVALLAKLVIGKVDEYVVDDVGISSSDIDQMNAAIQTAGKYSDSMLSQVENHNLEMSDLQDETQTQIMKNLYKSFELSLETALLQGDIAFDAAMADLELSKKIAEIEFITEQQRIDLEKQLDEDLTQMKLKYLTETGELKTQYLDDKEEILEQHYDELEKLATERNQIGAAITKINTTRLKGIFSSLLGFRKDQQDALQEGFRLYLGSASESFKDKQDEAAQRNEDLFASIMGQLATEPPIDSGTAYANIIKRQKESLALAEAKLEASLLQVEQRQKMEERDKAAVDEFVHQRAVELQRNMWRHDQEEVQLNRNRMETDRMLRLQRSEVDEKLRRSIIAMSKSSAPHRTLLAGPVLLAVICLI